VFGADEEPEIENVKPLHSNLMQGPNHQSNDRSIAGFGGKLNPKGSYSRGRADETLKK
jgi:hypothetical protein